MGHTQVQGTQYSMNKLWNCR